MQISTEYLTNGDREDLAIANKLKVAWSLFIGILHLLTLAHSKGQDQGHAHFDCF